MAYSSISKRALAVAVIAVMAVLLAACDGPAVEEGTAQITLTGAEWQWTSVTDLESGQTTKVAHPEQYTVVFNEDGTFSGMADCNSIHGDYTFEVDGGMSLTLGPRTMAYCGDDSMDEQFLELLASVVAASAPDKGGPAPNVAGGAQQMVFLSDDKTLALNAFPGVGGAEDRPVVAELSGPCAEAFAAAAAVGDMEDTVEDLDPALLACNSIEEWIAASKSNPGAIDTDPVEFLLNRCLYAEVPTGPACEEVKALYPDGLYVTPYETLTADDG
jgi:heat shock protein HslJ